MNNEQLIVNEITVGYSKGASVLRGLSLNVGLGRSLGVMGRNGMGKTTLMKAIMGLLPVSEGDVLFNGVSIANKPTYAISRLGVGYVPQGREIFAGFTVEENINIGAYSHDIKLADLEFIYHYFPILKERRRQRADTLSGGQQQMLAIARALASKPKMLLLDEPSEGIQPSIVEEIAIILRDINIKEELTILLVEQNFNMVKILTDHILFIENGMERDKVETSNIEIESEIFQSNMGL